MEEFFFEPRGIAYRKNIFDSGRPTLIFIHGLSGSCSAWYPYEDVLADKYNLLMLDLRGHGRSTKRLHYEDYELKKSAEDIQHLLKFLHIEQCILISHSYGTLVALEFLEAQMGNVSVAVFLSPTSFLRKTRWYWPTKIVGFGLVKLLRLLPFHPTVLGRVDYSPYVYTADWDVKRMFRDLRTTSVRVYLYCLTQTYAKDFDELWKRVQVPTLILHGTEDSYIPVEHSIRLAKEIPGSELILLEHANHIIVLNNIREVANHIEHAALDVKLKKQAAELDMSKSY